MVYVHPLIVVRHAQSEWNAAGRWQGWADPPLSSAGEDQARRAGAVLGEAIAAGDPPGPITAVWSSDLRRAHHTARLVAGAAGWDGPLHEVHDLREHDVGDWSGLTRDEIERRWPGLIRAWGDGRLPATPGGETRVDFDRRVRHAIARVATATEATGPGSSIVVTHGGVLRAVARWLGQPEQPFSQLEGMVIAGGGGPRPRYLRAAALLHGWADHRREAAAQRE